VDKTISDVSVKKVALGNTGIYVSDISIGTLPFASYRKNKKDFISLVRYAYNIGINLFDTAEIYENYDILGEALRDCPAAFIITKSYAVTREDVERSLLKARRELKRDVDIFLLHEQESIFTLRGHMEALEYLYRLKEKGDIKGIGISTHKVAGVKGAMDLRLDIVMGIINLSGLGISDGTRNDMEKVLKSSYEMGIGVIGMKLLGGGHLLPQIEDAISYAKNLKFIHSYLIGVEDIKDLELDIKLFRGLSIDKQEMSSIDLKPKHIEIEPWCTGCGLCVDRCKQGAIKIIDGKAFVMAERCVLCSYCAQVCPDFSIRLV
jgi:predicted aldo/keto reductase-like oxidoreductase